VALRHFTLALHGTFPLSSIHAARGYPFSDSDRKACDSWFTSSLETGVVRRGISRAARQ
jgi:hypothetical protein